MRYADAGVDLDAADRAKEALKDLVASTRDEHTLSEMGLFGGLYAVPGDVGEPVLVASADGVGTKLEVAFRADRHDSVGRDLVNHCVNDILVQGARPLFFLDYLATGDLEERIVSAVVRGIAEGCRENDCALLGGETAEMPDFYAAGEYDLAGFIVGLVDRPGILDGSRAEAGDALVAVGSSGLHTNGYTLARAIVFDRMGLDVDDPFPEGSGTVADVLLEVHRSYLGSVGPLVDDGSVAALAHITGGGLAGNLPRSLPPGLGARIDPSSWTVPRVFRVLQEAGEVDEAEMRRVFNMGIGLVAVVPGEDADSIVERLRDAGEDAWICGEVEDGEGVRFA